jgi:hypothetical protein
MPDLQKRIAQLEEQITELKARWPAHSAQPWMLGQLEDLEEELGALKEQERNEKFSHANQPPT